LALSNVRVAGAGLCVAFALSACGVTASGPVIGVPQPVQVSESSASASDALAAFQNFLDNQLSQAVATVSGSDGVQLAAEVNALANDASLIGAERVDALRALGEHAASTREAVVERLIGDVQADSKLAGTSVAGSDVGQTLIARLEAVRAQLEALAARIAGDSLTDVLRADVVSVGSSSRVYGLVSPVTHIVIAAGDTLHAANSLDQQNQQLVTQIAAGAASDPNYLTELKLSNNLQSAINTTRAVAGTAIQQVESLRPSDGASAQTLSSQRLALSALTGPNGALTGAAGDINQIRILLAQRQH
jgi:hypothetical protein